MSSVPDASTSTAASPDGAAHVTVVTGANSGIGRATSIHLAASGHRVIGTVRTVARAEKLAAMAAQAGVEVELVELDVADDDSVRDGFAEIFDRTGGRVDHLVNNAGVGGNAVVEESSIELLAEVMNVNLHGAVRCAQAVLPQMRERGAGTIVNVTSVAGRIATLAQAPYTASKWALEGVSEELAQELAPFGVRVAIIEPGVTKSAIFAKNIDAPNSTGAYDMHYGRMFQFYAAGMAHATDPFEVAEVIRHAIHTDTPVLRYAVSWGGPEIVAGRAAMSDEDWVELGRITDDTDYVERFERFFGVDISG
jgi:NAD(P)-dependent dehydrogenase (short-subunit alcohol dehydrogenase family)